MKMHIRIIIALAIRIIIALAIGFVIAMLLMSVKIYFGFTNAYSTNVNALTVKILGIPNLAFDKWEVAFYGGVLRNLCVGLGSARKRRSRGFRWELHSSNEGGRMFEPEGRVCAGA